MMFLTIGSSASNYQAQATSRLAKVVWDFPCIFTVTLFTSITLTPLAPPPAPLRSVAGVLQRTFHLVPHRREPLIRID